MATAARSGDAANRAATSARARSGTVAPAVVPSIAASTRATGAPSGMIAQPRRASAPLVLQRRILDHPGGLERDRQRIGQRVTARRRHDVHVLRRPQAARHAAVLGRRTSRPGQRARHEGLVDPGRAVPPRIEALVLARRLEPRAGAVELAAREERALVVDGEDQDPAGQKHRVQPLEPGWEVGRIEVGEDRDRDHDVESPVDCERAGVRGRDLARDTERVALERDRVGHHVGDGDALARMLAHQEAGGASEAAAEVEHGRSRRAGAETQAEELAQQPVRAPAAAEVVEDRAARKLVVQTVEKAQQRIGRRDAPIDAIVADREAQVVVE